MSAKTDMCNFRPSVAIKTDDAMRQVKDFALAVDRV